MVLTRCESECVRMPTVVEPHVLMGDFPVMSYDPLDVSYGALARLLTPSALDGPVVLAAPNDKCACAYVAPSIALTSAEPQTDAKHLPLARRAPARARCPRN